MPMPDMGKAVGPLPMGAWVALVGGGLGYMIYSRNKTSTASAAAAPATDALLSDVGYGGSGAVGAYTPTDGGINTPASSAGTPTSNSAWGRMVFNFLVGNGADGAYADKAVRDYLSGVALTTQENSLITQGLAKFGQTPEGLPDAPPLPVTPVTPVTPVVKPKPVVKPAPPKKTPPKSGPRTYIVKPGDNLSRIAQRFYGKPDWQRIYNANRAKIGHDPSFIRPLMVLVIP